MPFDITFQPVKVLVDGHDSEGRLIFADDQLTGVIMRLDGKAHSPAQKGYWHLEAGFGKAMCELYHRPSRRPKRLEPGSSRD